MTNNPQDPKKQSVLVEPGAGYPKVDPWFDVARLEHEVLDLWQETEAFEKLVEKNRGNEIYSFLDGPITANNPMGVHHAWGRTLKDVYQRYWAMNGRDQRYQNGFDCQGLWVEVEVEKEHNFSSKKEIEAYGIDRFVEACKARVEKYSAVQTDQSIRLGMWMDWDNSYFTMADDNNYAIWGFLKKCHERNKIYRGSDVMPWSGRSGSAYSQMEVIEGRKLVAHTALFLKFPLRERKGENLLVWTTTPWTLTSNVAASINVDLDYVKLKEKRSGEIFYFASENLEFQRLERQFNEKKEWVAGVPKLKTIAQIFNERGGYEVLGTIKGAEMVGWTYDGPFDELPAQAEVGGFPFPDEQVKTSSKEAHRVIDGGKDERGHAVVVAGEGTGIVHTAPGCGDIDHRIGAELHLPALAPLNEAAEFLEPFGFLAGKRATDDETVDLILQNLREKGLLIATEQYPHVYPHCWRTGDQLVFRLVDEWYIRMDWRDEIKKVVEDIRWIPEWGHDREIEWLTNMRDWMISKKRFWGLALPIWFCEPCNSFEVIGSYEELKERAVAGWEEANLRNPRDPDLGSRSGKARPPISAPVGRCAPPACLGARDGKGNSPHRPWVDQIEITCPHCGQNIKRVEDVGNPWLDAGIVPYSTVRYGIDNDHWKKWMPADLVLECFPGQFRNWFYSLLAMSTMLENMAPFRTLVGYALVRDETGKEMHKSTGNAIWFDDAAEKAGADLMRWLYCAHETTTNLNFGYGPLKEVRGKFINTLWNVFSFFANYARLADFSPQTETSQVTFEDLPDFDRWILTELQDTAKICREGIEEYDARRAALAIDAFVEKLSGWYIRHNRRRFWKSEDDKDLFVALATLHQCVSGVTRMAAPMIPFITEAIYQNTERAIDATAPISVHHTSYPTPDEGKVDRPLTEEMRAVMRLNGLALSAREAQKIKVRQPLSLLRIGPGDETEKRAAERFSEMLAEDLNVKKIEVLDVKTESPLTYEVKPNFKTLGSRLGKQMKAAANVIKGDADRLIAELHSGKDELAIELDGQKVALERADLLVTSSAPKDQTVAQDHDTWVAFDTMITEDLKLEGLMRDVIRRVQMLRKELDLEIENRIHLTWNSEDEAIQQVFERWEEHLSAEVLSLKTTRDEELTEGHELKLKNAKVVVAIEVVR